VEQPAFKPVLSHVVTDRMVFVLKATGEREPFDREKFIRSVMRGGAPRDVALSILQELEGGLRDGIPTREIYQRASKLLSSYDKRVSLRYALKNSIMKLGPSGFPFEDFVGAVLTAIGYDVSVRNVAHGRCVKHEIDIIATKGATSTLVECKYHNFKGVYTGLKEAMYTYARLLDIKEGYAEGHIGAKIESAMLVTNTKFSVDAVTYSECRGIELLGWRHPGENGLETIIDRERLYPVTILPDLRPHEAATLAACGIVLLRDLARFREEDVGDKTGVSKGRVLSLRKEAADLLG